MNTDMPQLHNATADDDLRDSLGGASVAWLARMPCSWLARPCTWMFGLAGDPVLQPRPALPAPGAGEKHREEMEEVYG